MSNKISYDRELSKDSYEEMVDSLNTLMQKGLELNSNMSGQIISDIVLPVNQSVNVSHNLKITPKYMIILRSRGNAFNVIDGDRAWNDSSISLKSIGNVNTELTVTILLMRG